MRDKAGVLALGVRALVEEGVLEYLDDEDAQTGHTPRMESPPYKPQDKTPSTPRVPPEDNVPKGCSLLSMEPLREWFCQGADMTSPAEYEAALCQLEEIHPISDSTTITSEKSRWTNFSLEGVKFPTATVDVIQRGEALAIFDERPHHPFPTDFKGRSLVCASIVVLEVYCRVDETTHLSVVSELMVALTNLDHDWHASTMRYGDGWAHDPTWSQHKRARPTHTDPGGHSSQYSTQRKPRLRPERDFAALPRLGSIDESEGDAVRDWRLESARHPATG